MKVVVQINRLLEKFPPHQRVIIAEEVLEQAQFEATHQEREWKQAAGLPEA